ncbi:hypothetical protein [Ottowia testudinis]|uniref:Uncharacterized protein n=1 Tax=Ottowia testudinis TaxID=2816950 RepID=A0A975CEV3_9BURK|nr:hypothetical protein [Ottowia testudinis]QTD44547.1 hypothetical protein J1M35_15820 [Ottowia testudinis]
MIIDQALKLTTDARLLEGMKASAKRDQSANERFEQRVSYVFGLMSQSSSVTKQQVRASIREQLEEIGAPNE